MRERQPPRLATTVPNNPGRAQDTSVAEGHRLASGSGQCVRCHVVERNPRGSWTDAPSFEKIANRPEVTRAWLSRVVLTPHPKMLHNRLSPQQANSIADYILSLRQP